MHYNLIVEKATGRLAFARPIGVKLYLDALWPAVTHYHSVYFDSPAPVGIMDHPWSYHFGGTKLTTIPFDPGMLLDYVLHQKKAWALQSLGRAVDRRRSVNRKTHELQDEVYSIKLWEAKEIIARPKEINKQLYAFLAQDAEFNGTSMLQEANAVMMRRLQARESLLESEMQRRKYTREILNATDETIAEITNRVREYESNS